MRRARVVAILLGALAGPAFALPPPAAPVRTLTLTSPLLCDGGASCTLAANRTLSLDSTATLVARGLSITSSTGITVAGAAATSGVTMVDSPKLTIDGSYWDGAAHAYPVTLQNVMLNPTAPTFSALEIGWNGAGAFRFDQPIGGSATLYSIGTGDTFAIGSSNEDRSRPAIDINGVSGALYVAGDAIVTVTGGYNSDRLLTIGTDATDGFTSGAGVITTGTVSTTVGIKATNLLIAHAAPTVSSGFGSGAAIAANNGTAAFRIGVGTSSASTGVIGLPTATTGWNCFCSDLSTISTTVYQCKQTASTTASATIGNFKTDASAAAWANSDVLAVSCFGY